MCVTDAGTLVVCGLPGVGKSTVARQVADRIDATVVRSDAVRKALYADPTYSAEETASVYDALLSRAEDRLERGESVVLDATFADDRFRTAAVELGAAVTTEHTLVCVECDRAVAERRIRERDDISDADVDVYRQFADVFTPFKRRPSLSITPVTSARRPHRSTRTLPEPV
jgi:predicted kinase